MYFNYNSRYDRIQTEFIEMVRACRPGPSWNFEKKKEIMSMGMTMTQKILAAHAGLPEVKAGQLIEARLDLVLGNDITTPVAIREMEKLTAIGRTNQEMLMARTILAV